MCMRCQKRSDITKQRFPAAKSKLTVMHMGYRILKGKSDSMERGLTHMMKTDLILRTGLDWTGMDWTGLGDFFFAQNECARILILEIEYKNDR